MSDQGMTVRVRTNSIKAMPLMELQHPTMKGHSSTPVTDTTTSPFRPSGFVEPDEGNKASVLRSLAKTMLLPKLSGSTELNQILVYYPI